MNFWDCSPNETIGYIDQSSLFLKDPDSFLFDYYVRQKHKLPTHFVVFDEVAKKSGNFFAICFLLDSIDE